MPFLVHSLDTIYPNVVEHLFINAMGVDDLRTKTIRGKGREREEKEGEKKGKRGKGRERERKGKEGRERERKGEEKA